MINRIKNHEYRHDPCVAHNRLIATMYLYSFVYTVPKPSSFARRVEESFFCNKYHMKIIYLVLFNQCKMTAWSNNLTFQNRQICKPMQKKYFLIYILSNFEMSYSVLCLFWRLSILLPDFQFSLLSPLQTCYNQVPFNNQNSVLIFYWQYLA